ncbi:MAG: hypothetical protein ACAI35_00655 [Candidatus Methylacidiphilales bacterium]|nr:hypothetical protein [Candidatus Methylacidiphilales bacterium]
MTTPAAPSASVAVGTASAPPRVGERIWQILRAEACHSWIWISVVCLVWLKLQVWVAIFPLFTLDPVNCILFPSLYFVICPLVRLGSLLWQAWFQPAAAGMPYEEIKGSAQGSRGKLVVHLASYYWWQPLALLILTTATPLLLRMPWMQPLGQEEIALLPLMGIYFLFSCSFLVPVSKAIATGCYDLTVDFDADTLSVTRDTSTMVYFFQPGSPAAAPRVLSLKDVVQFGMSTTSRNMPFLDVTLRNGHVFNIIGYHWTESSLDPVRTRALANWLNEKLNLEPAATSAARTE